MYIWPKLRIYDFSEGEIYNILGRKEQEEGCATPTVAVIINL
jgi:hypothetical protein